MQFSEKLKKLRTDNGISQSKLAKALFVSRSAVAKWENGLGEPCEQSLAQIAEYFAVSKEYFYADNSAENKTTVDDKTAMRNSSMPHAAKICSLVATIMLFIYAVVISAFIASSDHFDGGLTVLTECMVAALIIVGIIINVVQFRNGQGLWARFLAYGVGVGVGVVFSCFFATSYLGYVKYGSFCVGAPVALIAANELMLFIVRRTCNVSGDCGTANKRANRMLYVCLAIATVMFGLCLYPLIIHTVEFNYSLGVLIFSSELFLSVIAALLVAITDKRHTKNVLAYSFGALAFCGMLLIVPAVLDISYTGIDSTLNFYEYLAYEITALLACGTVLILAIRHYCADVFRAAFARLSHVPVNNR